MFKHEKQLFHPVAVERPNPQYAALLQEQLGGGNGELKAAMQYLSQSFRIKDQKIKDLFLDIAAEEMCIRDRYIPSFTVFRFTDTVTLLASEVAPSPTTMELSLPSIVSGY